MVSPTTSDERSSLIPSPDTLLMQTPGKPRAHLSASRRNGSTSVAKSAFVSTMIGVAPLSQTNVGTAPDAAR